jgi:hypothetical protein
MSKAQTLIEQFYQEEIARKAEEATFTPLDITVSSADMALISTISKRFSKDKNLLVREAVSQALLDMFSALEPIERKILAKDADELAKAITAEIAEDQGLSSLDVSGANWVQQDKNCVKDERKAEKVKAMQQASAAQTVLGDETPAESHVETPTESLDVAEELETPNEDVAAIEQTPFKTEETAELETSPQQTSSIFG